VRSDAAAEGDGRTSPEISLDLQPGLVFTGGTADRKFHAFDAATGKLLWEFPLSSGIEAPPTSFAINGKQYIAVLAGWGQDAGGEVNMLARLFPGEVLPMPDGGTVWVFALE
jgi:alcohol dehydrogenase (cytochrome c)